MHNEKNKKLIYGGVLGALLAIGVPIIINWAYMSDRPVFFTVWGGAEILNYYGILLGAVATIGAVVATIEHNSKIIEKQNYYDASKINIPFLKIENIKVTLNLGMKDGHTYYFKEQLEFSDNTWDMEFIAKINEIDTISYRFEMELKNIGEGISLYTSDDDPERLTLSNAAAIEVGKCYEAVYVGEFEFREQGTFAHKIIYSNIRGVFFSQKFSTTFSSLDENLLMIEVYPLSPQDIEP